MPFFSANQEQDGRVCYNTSLAWAGSKLIRRGNGVSTARVEQEVIQL
jgi:hypothetical protein